MFRRLFIPTTLLLDFDEQLLFPFNVIYNSEVERTDFISTQNDFLKEQKRQIEQRSIPSIKKYKEIKSNAHQFEFDPTGTNGKIYN